MQRPEIGHRAAASDEPSDQGAWTWLARNAVRLFRLRADGALALLDVALVVTAYGAMLLVRFEADVPADAWDGLWSFLPIAVMLHLVFNGVAGLYGPVWRHASILEAKRILLAGIGSTAMLTGGVLLGSRLVPLSVTLTGGLAATGLMGVLRFQSRLFAFNRRVGEDRTRVLVVGAGYAGDAILREIERSPNASMAAVAMVDDDPRKVGRSIGNVPIAGTLADIVRVGRDHDVDVVLLAIPSADSALVRRVADAVGVLGVPMKVLPGVSELMSTKPRLGDVRDVSIDDLLGRQPIATDLATVAHMIRDRRVLVTGGGGSIGAEIVRQVAEYAPERLIVLDRDETNLFDAMASIDDRGHAVLLDIRDRQRLRRLFLDERPEIVFHAAANKHVPMLEAHPSEAAATNVLGTDNLVAVAREVDVAHLVFVSTDKAVAPSSVMGASKRAGEQLVLSSAPQGSAWCAVRFGNVLGSRGSVVPTFMRQIAQGGPVTLTHPDMTRFFMSIPEAVQLVLQAAALAEDREIFMLDMGAPVRIMDLATRMISLAGLRVGTDVAIEVTGLRPGEKLTEELHTSFELPSDTVHPKIFQLATRVSDPSALDGLLMRLRVAIEQYDDGRIRELLMPDGPQSLACDEPEGGGDATYGASQVGST